VSTPRYPNSAIVLGTEVNGIAVVRSLGRLGVRCSALTSTTQGDHAHQSRYLKHVKVISRAATDAEIAIAVRDIAAFIGGSKPVLIPTTDRFSEFLSRYRNVLEADFFLCCPDLELCDTFLDKWKTAQICNRHGVPIPRTTCPQTDAELAEVAGGIAFPVVVKPRYTFGTGFPGKNAVFTSSDELLSFLGGSALLGHCIVQEIIPSGDGDILVVASYSGDDRLVKAIYSGRKIRQHLPDYGATCFGLSERHPDLESQAARFLQSIQYRGFAALEYARSRTDGMQYFIELNTRTYYHNQLFADAGIDLTQVAYLDATGRDVRAALGQLRQREGLLWLDFRRDFQSMRIKRKQKRITAFEWLRSILKARSFAYWSWRDPLPFLAGCVWRCGDMAMNVLARTARGFNP